MSNRIFNAFVAVVILLLIVGVLLDKYATCQASGKGFDECFHPGPREDYWR